MALQNIGRDNKDDAFYRYKMPRMITKIEGRGNGIKTNVVNMVDIAKALARPASYTTKYFGCELGAQSKFDEKTGTSHVNGAHDTSKLAGLLENFIKKYVQCYGCGNPETEIVITKTQMVTLKCIACGFVSDVDMRDKLTTFIIKNPPEKKGAKDKKAMRRAEKERLKEGEAVDEEQKKLKKEAVKKKIVKDTNSKVVTKKKSNVSDDDRSPSRIQVDDDDDEIGDADDGIQWQTDTSAEAARQRIQEQLSNVTAGMVMLSTGEEKPSSGKTSPAREEKSKSNGEKSGKNSPACEENFKPNGHSNGVSKSSENPSEKLVLEVKEYLEKNPSASQLKNFMGTQSATPQEVMNALFEALFDGIGKGFSKEAIKKKNYLAAAMAATHEDESQLVLLEALEGFCGKAKQPEAVKEVALVLKGLYDNDLLEEEYIVKWYEKGSSGTNKAMWKYVKPFVEWLQNAESETEDE